ncbi:triacylglycerol lipase [Ancylostoma ceylanicum]|uniref:Triacylglycerol lipase n=1 Tax=Ancylostoma ceylanicum TaxID=53326 RepID=A0A0D6LNE1_9BILA|nr:triacylglycerol lipase [Ancylostoma ceylanicum]
MLAYFLFLFFCSFLVAEAAVARPFAQVGIDEQKRIKCENLRSCAECTNTTTAGGGRCEWCGADSTCRRFLFNSCSLNARMAEVLQSCFDRIEIINSHVITDPSNLSDWFAYLAYWPKKEAIVVVFRGSTSIFQLIDQGISFFLHPKVNHPSTGGLVDDYYLQAFHAFWNAGMKQDFEAAARKYPKARVWCFGHSLGGSLASLAAAHISAHYKKKDTIQLVTFGQPKVGDTNFAEGHSKLVPNAVRVVHDKDPVPALPPRLFHWGLGEQEWIHHHYEHKIANNFLSDNLIVHTFNNTLNIRLENWARPSVNRVVEKPSG